MEDSSTKIVQGPCRRCCHRLTFDYFQDRERCVDSVRKSLNIVERTLELGLAKDKITTEEVILLQDIQKLLRQANTVADQLMNQINKFKA